MINMSGAYGTKKTSESPTGIEPMTLILYTGQVLSPLSHEGLVASWAIYKVHACICMMCIQCTARISNVEIVVCDK